MVDKVGCHAFSLFMFTFSIFKHSLKIKPIVSRNLVFNKNDVKSKFSNAEKAHQDPQKDDKYVPGNHRKFSTGFLNLCCTWLCSLSTYCYCPRCHLILWNTHRMALAWQPLATGRTLCTHVVMGKTTSAKPIASVSLHLTVSQDSSKIHPSGPLSSPNCQSHLTGIWP